MAASIDLAGLREIQLFYDLPPVDLERIAPLLHSKTYPAGTNIINQEEPGETTYIIQQGTVKIHIETANGNSVILAILGPNEVVGEMSLLDSLGRSASVTTLESSTILWLNRTNFWNCLQIMPLLMFNLANILSRRIRLANEHIHSLATLDVHGRVARQILAFAKEYGKPVNDNEILIPIRLTQTDLAGLTGSSRVRVNQALINFKQHNFISIDQSYRIKVLNSPALEQRCR